MLPESAPADGLTIRLALWAIDVGDVPFVDVQVPHDVATGDPASYPRCQAHARHARGRA